MKNRKMKFLIFFLGVISILGTLSACKLVDAPTHTHNWEAATCTTSKKCKECGQVEGDPLGHQGGTADCQHKAICETCGLEYGKLGDHDWEEATCTTPKTCKVCKTTEGSVLGHNYSIEWTIDKEATCTEEGSKSHHCLECNEKTDVTTIDMLEHTYGNWIVVTEATETTTGLKEKECSSCHHKETETIPVLTHVHKYSTDWTIDKEATCTEEGSKSHHCLGCSEKTDITSIEMIDHTYGAWTTTKKPTCEEAGSKNRTCSNCNKVETESITALGHKYSTEWTTDKEATCKEEGSKSHHCTRCVSKKDVTTIEKLAHTAGTKINENITPADCVHTGSHEEVVYCTVCNTEISRETKTDAALGHHGGTATCQNKAICEVCKQEYGELKEHNWGAATCTTPKTCKVCKTTDGTALGHSYGAWTTTKEPTCEEAGSKNRTCSRCNDVEIESITALGHNYSTEWTIDVEATCTQAGSKSHHCTRCDNKTDITSIKIKEHTYGNWIVVTEATESTTGLKEKVCSVCHHKETETIPVLSHVHKYSTDWTIDKEATCTEEGSKSHHCLGCSEKTDITPIEMIDHTYGDWTTTKEATCEEAGSKNRTCSRCNDVEIESITALGHKYSTEWTTDKEATCKEEGSKSHHCTRCDSKKDVTTIEKLAHTAGTKINENITPADCEHTGSHDEVVYCTVCKAEISRETKTDAALGHHGGTATCQNKAICEVCKKEYGELKEHSWEAATCTTPKTCTTCKTTEGSALGHTYGAWTTTKEATCEEAGSRNRTCSNCNKVETESITALGHKYSTDWTIDVEATCTQAGSKSHHCTRCDSKKDVTVIEKLAHTEGTIVNENVTAATCEHTGSHDEVVYCTVCNTEISRETKTDAALGHKGGIADCQHKAICEVCKQEYGELKEHSWEAATCTTPKTCTTCKTTEESALGHTYGNWTITKEPTCEEVGSKNRTCSICNKVETESITALGHKYSTEWTTDKEATCKEEGSKSHHCTRCDSKKDVTTIEKLAHTAGTKINENITPADCEHTGSHDEVVYCTVCKAEISRETKTDAALGHHGGTATCQNKAICEVCGVAYGELGDHVWKDITGGKQCEVCNEIVSNSPTLPTDITDKVLITDSMVTIPFGAISATGIYKITTISGTIEINWASYDGTSEKYQEYGIAGGSGITFTMENEIIYKLEADIYEYNNTVYNNMNLYKGSSSTGVLIDSTTVNLGTKTGNKYAYIIDGGATELYYVNTYTKATNFYNIYLYTKQDSEPDIPPVVTEGIVEDIIYDDFQIHFLELGNKYTGDSTYIKAGDVDILIDAGSRKDSATTIKEYVDQYCTDGKLEYVIATHAHQDHIAGFVGSNSGNTKTGIYYQYQIGTIIDYSRSDATSVLSKDYVTAREYAITNGAKHYTAEECFNNVNGASSTYTFFEGCQMTILYNYYYFNSASSTDGGENNYSVCTMFNYNDHHFMFTGDLELEGEQALADYYDGSTAEKTLPHCDVFKGGHHGSKTSSNDCLLSKITPSICCVCCCAGSAEYTANYKNMFPTQEFINRIAKYTDRVYVTSLFNEETKTNESMNGNIIVSCNGQTIGLKASNNLTKLKDSAWFNETIYVVGENHCSGKGKTDFYTSATANAVPVVRRTWPNLE